MPAPRKYREENFRDLLLGCLTLMTLFGCVSKAPQPSVDPSPAVARDQAPVVNAVATDSLDQVAPADVIVAGRFVVDVMELVVPRRAVELTERMQLAISENPVWWSAHVATTESGQPLAYDPRLGVSEDEYVEYLSLVKRLSAQKKSQANLEIIARGDSVYEFNGGEELPDLTGIRIDVETRTVETPFGVTSDWSEIETTEESALGTWVGVSWRLDSLGLNGATAGSLGIGKLKASRKSLIYYKLTNIGLSGKTEILQILEY